MPIVAGGMDRTTYRVRWARARGKPLRWGLVVPLLLPTKYLIASRMPETRITAVFLQAASIQGEAFDVKLCGQDPWSESIRARFIPFTLVASIPISP